jgi:cell wall-associated NlpC family hydrolase
LAEVTARIAQLQSMFTPVASSTTAVSTSATATTDFASSLSTALGDTSTDTSASSLASILGGSSLSDITGTSSGTSSGTSTSASGSSATGAAMAALAQKYVGVPYVAGGRNPSSGWDCAGFTHWVAKQCGVTIPDVSWLQIKHGSAVPSISEAKPGDLLFFHEPGGHHHDPSPLGVNHVAIYIGGGKMVEAASPRAGTRISSVDKAHLVGIRRVAGTGTVASVAATTSTSAASGTASVGAVPRTTAQLTPRQLVSSLEKAGFSGESLHVAWAVAMRESHGRPGALSPKNSNGTRDHGLFQINDCNLGRVIDLNHVYDPVANAKAAYRMSAHGTNWSSWGLGTSGWAGHLAKTNPAVHAQLKAAFDEWYARFPGA